MTHIEVQNWKSCSNYITYTKHTVLDLFKVCSNYTNLNYSGQKSRKQLAVYDSDTLVILKETWSESVDPEQGYDHAKFEKLRLNSVHKKNGVQVFLSSQKTHHKSPFN